MVKHLNIFSAVAEPQVKHVEGNDGTISTTPSESNLIRIVKSQTQSMTQAGLDGADSIHCSLYMVHQTLQLLQFFNSILNKFH
ncbi:hypothetical protein [Belliella aquatica]|uniref:hypothetical protein n=1 Tax=Belliella aquatica TaxID=1323734 RepID=UPI0016657A25|nr:hypothetical protein [Belliella aquatica]MCH7404499.1 hypothetical protein [Belliella aquatica]